MKDNLKNIICSSLTFYSIYKYFDLYLNNNYLIYGLEFVLFIALFLFYKYLGKNFKLEKKYQVLSAIISFILVLGYSYELTSTGNLFWGSIQNLFNSLIKVFGYFIFINVLFMNIIKFLEKSYKTPKWTILERYKQKPFLYSFIFLFICYSIFLIIYYPGIINYDNANQIKEFFGFYTRYIAAINPISNSTLTNFNPIVHTVLLGGMVKIGYFLGNYNLGMFMYSVWQMLIVIICYSYTLSYAIKKNINPLYSLIILLFLGLVPIFGYYSITAVKDTLYTAFLVLFSLEIYDYFKKDKLTKHDYISLYLISMLVILFRNNGLYIVILTIPFLIKKKNVIAPLVVLGLVLTSYMSYSKILLPSLGISGTSIRETLSIPFQQTARVAKYHNYPFNEEEKEAISKILDYENLAIDYDENLADPVKNKFNKDYTNADLINYFKVWFSGLTKYPLTYVDATINNVTGYFYPFENKWKIYHKLNPKIPEAGFDYHYNNLSGLRKIMHNYEIGVECSPLGIFLNIGIITWLSILVFVGLLNKKRNYVFLIPNIISILFCILSPANTYYRYIYPSLLIMVTLFPLIKNCFEKKS